MSDARAEENSELRDLEARLRTLQQEEPDSDEDFRRLAEAVAQLERDRFVAGRRAAGGESVLDPDGLELLEDRTYDLAVLVNAAETWRAACERDGLTSAAQACEDALHRWRFRHAVAWRAETSAALESASLEEAFELSREAERFELGRAPERLDEAATEILARTKLAIRERIERRLAEGERPSARVLTDWRRSTIDRVDATLAEAEDADPATAIARLDAAESDVVWHLERVERTCGGESWRLRRRLARLRAEREERSVQNRLERTFGRSAVAWFERLTFVLLFVLTGLLLAEGLTTPSPRMRLVYDVADLAICSVFLLDFFVKWGFSGWSASWFRRHFLIDLLPAIPIGFGLSFLETAQAADWLRFGRWLRMLRLSYSVRYLRFLLPVLRALRAAAFFARALDRVARRYARLMNHDVILYPNRDEMEAAYRTLPPASIDGRFLQREIRQLWRRTVEDAPETLRDEVASIRAAALAESLDAYVEREVVDRRMAATSSMYALSATARAVTASRALEILASVAPEELEALLEPETVARIARGARLLSYLPTSWIGWARFVPARTGLSNSEIAAAACRRAAAILSRWHDAAYWVADHHGTVSPSLFVDRLGSLMVRNSARPATRLLLFGGVYLVVQAVLMVVPIEALEPLASFLRKYVGTTLLVLGGICLIVFAIGWWLKQIAREATEFYDRFAQAQFLALTETIRERRRASDLGLLYDRVLRAEWALVGADVAEDRERRLTLMDSSLASATSVARDAVDAAALARTERAALLYRDWLDGAMFVDNDDRATVQALGNPSLLQFYESSRRVTKSDVRKMQRLDLEHCRTAIDGPCQWYRRIAQSISHSVAAALVEYNRQAVPLDELQYLDETGRERHRKWLSRQDGDAATNEPSRGVERYVTTAFHALHFLDDDPLRDAEIAARFGDATLERLRAERIHLTRTVFGTAPLHDRPRRERVFNAYRAYRTYVEGGRWIVAPISLVAWSYRKSRDWLRWTAKTVWEIRRPDRRRRVRTELEPDFLSAMRKIDRVRRPLALATTRLRALVDPEYLAASLPLRERTGREGIDLDQDLAFLRPDPLFEEEIRDQRLRAAADMARLEKLFRGGLRERLAERLDVSPDRLRDARTTRAIAVAYFADLDGVRVHLSPQEIVREAGERTQMMHAFGPVRWRYLLLGGAFREWVRRRGVSDQASRRAAWRGVVHDVWDAGECLRIWRRLGDSAPAEGERRLAEALRHPGRIDEYLMSIRTIQTLALLDVAYYRRQVYRLGAYGESGVDFGARLRWMDRDWGASDSEDTSESTTENDPRSRAAMRAS